MDEAPLTHTLADVRAMVEQGEATFWPFARSAMVSTFWENPRSKAFHHWLVGGDLDDLMSHRDEVQAWAKAQGCTLLLAAGRKGWERVMKPYGFEFAGVMLAKELP